MLFFGLKGSKLFQFPQRPLCRNWNFKGVENL